MLSEPLRLLSVGAFALAATVLAGAAAAQDYDAGKTGPQMFASDCSACHNKPGGLAKGRDKGSLTSFLREHYTTKQESAALLAAYLLGAPASAEVKPDVPGGPKAKTRKAEREEEQKAAPKPEPKPRAEPARRSDEPAAEPSEEAKRPRADEAPKATADPVLSKLKYYGSARGPAKDTARLGNPGARLESYANSGAATVTPDTPAAKPRNTAQKKKKKDTDASASVAGGAPQPPRPAHPPGNN